MNDLVKNNNGELMTTSKIISDVFGKAHRDTVRAINNLECSDEFRSANFIESSYTSSQNKTLDCYKVTRIGAVFLCTGFTGKRALAKKEKLIAAFDESIAIESVMDIIKGIDIDDHDSYIYVMRESESGRYKVGISKDPERRLKQLNTGNPEKLSIVYCYLAINGFKDESKAHSILSKYSIKNEWFDGDADLSKIGALNIND